METGCIPQDLHGHGPSTARSHKSVRSVLKVKTRRAEEVLGTAVALTAEGEKGKLLLR